MLICCCLGDSQWLFLTSPFAKIAYSFWEKWNGLADPEIEGYLEGKEGKHRCLVEWLKWNGRRMQLKTLRFRTLLIYTAQPCKQRLLPMKPAKQLKNGPLKHLQKHEIDEMPADLTCFKWEHCQSRTWLQLRSGLWGMQARNSMHWVCPIPTCLTFLLMNMEGRSHAQSDGLNQHVAFGWLEMLRTYEPVLASGVKSAPSQ